MNPHTVDASAAERIGELYVAFEEPAGKRWIVPHDALPSIPRCGETVRLGDGSVREVIGVTHELAPSDPPIGLGREMPQGADYATPVRIVVRLST